jgi:hypothetical protein
MYEKPGKPWQFGLATLMGVTGVVAVGSALGLFGFVLLLILGAGVAGYLICVS